MKPVALAAALLAVASPATHAATITSAERTAALRALDDEYHAYATYQAVIDRFGAVRPFTNIQRAEARHANALIGYLQSHGIVAPANPYLTGAKPMPDAPASLAEACAVGVQAEIANAGLYDDDLLPAARGDAELTRIFVALRDASQQKHLPAFQRCGGGGQGGGHGKGMGQGKGWGRKG
ncbi:hypothetical protein VK792_09495 [Mesobacterium sp. TK19101]|uniref:DUF2202 domain-containing protein n=1 Tax=Mesobacterium hydrothermale TaxID=3111907 RepID=A0ABU6HHX9_9RHOB|nr:hypothetical protein [Mesobacterium sp. TK19101]MEC3861516.1 hypothetical protein [Mesobacterium sp. TK19101]